MIRDIEAMSLAESNSPAAHDWPGETFGDGQDKELNSDIKILNVLCKDAGYLFMKRNLFFNHVDTMGPHSPLPSRF